MNIAQAADNATTAKVTFSNLRSAGTVYVVNADTSKAATSTLALALDEFKPDDVNSYTAKATVEKGAPSVDVANAIHSIKAGVGTATTVDDQYAVVFIPDDASNYSTILTSGGAVPNINANVPAGTTFGSLQVKAAETTYTLAETAGAVTANGTAKGYTATAFDQFGDAMAISTAHTVTLTPGQALNAGETSTITLRIAAGAVGASDVQVGYYSGGKFNTTDDASHSVSEVSGNKYTVKLGKTTFTVTFASKNGTYNLYTVGATS